MGGTIGAEPVCVVCWFANDDDDDDGDDGGDDGGDDDGDYVG